jgi:hypothetical protein
MGVRPGLHGFHSSGALGMVEVPAESTAPPAPPRPLNRRRTNAEPVAKIGLFC